MVPEHIEREAARATKDIIEGKLSYDALVAKWGDEVIDIAFDNAAAIREREQENAAQEAEYAVASHYGYR